MRRNRPGGSSPAGYWGADRRRIAAQQLPWAAPAAGMAIFAVAVMVASSSTVVPVRAAGTMLTSAALMGALLLAVMSGLTWRASGRTAPLWLAMAATAYAVVLVLHLGELQPGLLWRPAEGGLASALAPASRVAVLAGLVGAALWHPVDTRLNPLRVFLAGGIVVGMATGLFVLLPGLAPALLSHAHETLTGGFGSSQTVGEALPTALPIVWAVVAGLVAVQAHRRGDAILAWATLLALTLGGAEALRQLVGTPESFVAAELARSAGLLVTAVALGASGAALATVHRRALGTAAQASKAAEGRLQAADAAQAELRHEVQNALTAVHAAAATLHAHHELLAPADRAQLSGAVSREIERLRLLLDNPGATGALDTVRLVHAVEAPVTGARAQGVAVHVDVPSHLLVLAREEGVAQVVTVLLDNACKHAPGSPVWLHASVQSDGVVLRCADRGPGIPPDERQDVFARGHRGRTAGGQGSGLGLAVAARLMREQGGTVWAEEHPGGGASIALWFAKPTQEEWSPRQLFHHGGTEDSGPSGVVGDATGHRGDAHASSRRTHPNGDAVSRGREPVHLRLRQLRPFRHRST